MSSVFFWPYLILLTTLFTLYAQGVRRAVLKSKSAILSAGIAVGAVALVGLLFLLGPGQKIAVLLINTGMMSLCTAYCIVMAQKSARSEEVLTQGRLSVWVASAYRLPFADALIVPTSTALRALTGPSAALIAAGGKDLEREVKMAKSLNLDKTLYTGAGTLGVGKLIHVAVFTPDDLHLDAGRLKKGLQAALLAARKDGAKTVALVYAPLRGIAPKEAAQLYREAARKYEDDFEASLIVLLDGRHEAAFVQ
jgi:hypothetical protein